MSERQIKHCESVCKDILEFANQQLNLDIKSEPLDWADDVDSPWAMNFDGITLIANEDFSEFEVGYETYNPGGYWEPPSSDYVEHSKHKNVKDAMWGVINLWVQQHYQWWCESKHMEEVFPEEELENVMEWDDTDTNETLNTDDNLP